MSGIRSAQKSIPSLEKLTLEHPLSPYKGFVCILELATVKYFSEKNRQMWSTRSAHCFAVSGGKRTAKECPGINVNPKLRESTAGQALIL